ncbi:MAG: hypothetical protein EOO27_13200 [Comamonadaceae bacterium]|nr:MAG: hypothetical protein EOO27_13200 [Comamonadaceae bacterium]
MLEFVDPDRANQTLALYWRMSRRLQEALKALPQLEPPIVKLDATAPKAAALLGVEEFIRQSSGGKVSMTFQTLPQMQFEVLALRFRPFFAQNEQIHFLSILKLLGHKNEQAREPLGKLKEQWNGAAFWTMVQMVNPHVKVDADSVIRIGFYSKYFHVEPDKLLEAEKYRKAMGDDLFEIALVSSVWERSRVVVMLALAIEPYLLRVGAITQKEIDDSPPADRESITVEHAVGPGAIRMGPAGMGRAEWEAFDRSSPQ